MKYINLEYVHRHPIEKRYTYVTSDIELAENKTRWVCCVEGRWVVFSEIERLLPGKAIAQVLLVPNNIDQEQCIETIIKYILCPTKILDTPKRLLCLWGKMYFLMGLTLMIKELVSTD